MASICSLCVGEKMFVLAQRDDFLLIPHGQHQPYVVFTPPSSASLLHTTSTSSRMWRFSFILKATDLSRNRTHTHQLSILTHWIIHNWFYTKPFFLSLPLPNSVTKIHFHPLFEFVLRPDIDYIDILYRYVSIRNNNELRESRNYIIVNHDHRWPFTLSTACLANVWHQVRTWPM